VCTERLLAVGYRCQHTLLYSPSANSSVYETASRLASRLYRTKADRQVYDVFFTTIKLSVCRTNGLSVQVGKLAQVWLLSRFACALALAGLRVCGHEQATTQSSFPIGPRRCGRPASVTFCAKCGTLLRGRALYGRSVRWRCACRTVLGAFDCVYVCARTQRPHCAPGRVRARSVRARATTGLMVVFVLARRASTGHTCLLIATVRV
jgi:hypothetical protein